MKGEYPSLPPTAVSENTDSARWRVSGGRHTEVSLTAFQNPPEWYHGVVWELHVIRSDIVHSSQASLQKDAEETQRLLVGLHTSIASH